jgi:hypothetical protein
MDGGVCSTFFDAVNSCAKCKYGFESIGLSLYCKGSSGTVPTPAGMSGRCNGTNDTSSCSTGMICQYTPYGYFCGKKPTLPASLCESSATKCVLDGSKWYQVPCGGNGTWDFGMRAMCNGACNSTTGKCDSIGCNPNDTRCRYISEKWAVERCTNNGSWMSTVQCEKGCIDSACVDRDVTPMSSPIFTPTSGYYNPGTSPAATVTDTPGVVDFGCNDCLKNFKCYKGTNSEYRWFTDGYVMEGFVLADPAAGQDCAAAGVPKPTFKGKGMGDANCDGLLDVTDYSQWLKEFSDGNKGVISKNNWSADFTGNDGTCDGLVNVYDYSLWLKYFNELRNQIQ